MELLYSYPAETSPGDSTLLDDGEFSSLLHDGRQGAEPGAAALALNEERQAEVEMAQRARRAEAENSVLRMRLEMLEGAKARGGSKALDGGAAEEYDGLHLSEDEDEDEDDDEADLTLYYEVAETGGQAETVLSGLPALVAGEVQLSQSGALRSFDDDLPLIGGPVLWLAGGEVGLTTRIWATGER